MFRTKAIDWLGADGSTQTARVVLQNKNGPCFLLAYVNCLLMAHEAESWDTVGPSRQAKSGLSSGPSGPPSPEAAGSGKFSQGSAATAGRPDKRQSSGPGPQGKLNLGELKQLVQQEEISEDALLQAIVSFSLEESGKRARSNSGEQSDQISLDPILGVLPRLGKRLMIDLNLTDPEVTDFAGDTEGVQQLMNLGGGLTMYHAFISTDPEGSIAQLAQQLDCPNGISFDRCMEWLAQEDEAEQQGSEGCYKDAALAENLRSFFKQHLNQITAEGMQLVKDQLCDGDFAIFFRNDHFNTLYRHFGELYTLVNDEGYLDKDVVWELLGEDTLLSGQFGEPVGGAEPMGDGGDAAVGKTADEMLALQLQQEEDEQLARQIAGNEVRRAKQKPAKSSKSAKPARKSASAKPSTPSNPAKKPATLKSKNKPLRPTPSKKDDCTIM